ncbi:MAG: DUF1302 domain-containing protein [Deltaproteobacteria bacterium]|nr:DUF1302 domain-containing protein [Deltaproteobacteria bacterium]
MTKSNEWRSYESLLRLLTITIAGTLLLFLPSAHAFKINTGVPGLKLYWDNTVKYSASFRVEGQSGTLTDPARNPSNGNQDDGDRNFDKGLISNRFDLLSELDVIYKNFGVRVSGAAWYDFVYNEDNNNDSPMTANALSVPHDEFTDNTRDLHGRDAEILDAFAFGKVDMGNNAVSFRVGQFAQLWGESLFFGNNGIAGGMAPIDVVKLLSVPNTQFKELIRPVPQVASQLQIGSRLTIGAYYQFGWEETRLPASGSYFSRSDILVEGGERLFLGGPIMDLSGGGPPVFGAAPEAWFRGNDLEADDAGQGGIQVLVRPGENLDLGFYAIRYHDKTPQVYARMFKVPGAPLGSPAPVFNPPGVDLNSGKSGEYFLVYPEDIEMYGITATSTFGGWNVATEISYRCNTPLVSLLHAFPGIPGMPEPDNDDNPGYAVGDSVHAQVNWLAVFGPSFISREATFLGEVAWHRRTDITDNPDALDPNTTKEAWGIRMVYEPKYRQVLPGLDLSVPLGFAYFPKGTSSVITGFGSDKGGDMSIGLGATYLDAWRCKLSYTHFYGSEHGNLDKDQHFSLKQPLADRDFISFSVWRTF